ncbi:hypothetical protein [Leptolyngbya sp. O-77]|uniref:hypothetical protein n=1 Tax=Leptolyngbya sp. O-77 TaxID=1080068 RepID=UPI0012E35791|nr:hypothetical protein [Leptolyngbya sp. O-77]
MIIDQRLTRVGQGFSETANAGYETELESHMALGLAIPNKIVNVAPNLVLMASHTDFAGTFAEILPRNSNSI